MQNVTEDRNLYLGGSDIAAVLNISKFKKRRELLEEKAGIRENTFTGNAYTEYGNRLEPLIREYINAVFGCNFIETKKIDGYRRYHADGDDAEKAMLLEIKTTSQIHDRLEDYDYYLCQILYGMSLYGYDLGYLVVYKRPEDFDEEFDPSRVRLFEVKLDEHYGFLRKIESEVQKFREEWLALLENPFLTEEEMLPVEVQTLATEYKNIQAQLEFYKQVVEEEKQLKTKLYKAMNENNIKGWTTPDGWKLTNVSGTEDTTEWAFDEQRFKSEHPELYDQYLIPKKKKGKAGYVKITQPKHTTD